MAIPLSVTIYGNVLIVIHHIRSVPLSKSAEMVRLLWLWSVVMTIFIACVGHVCREDVQVSVSHWIPLD